MFQQFPIDTDENSVKLVTRIDNSKYNYLKMSLA